MEWVELACVLAWVGVVEWRAGCVAGCDGGCEDDALAAREDDGAECELDGAGIDIELLGAVTDESPAATW